MLTRRSIIIFLIVKLLTSEITCTRLENFEATEFSEMLSGRRSRQGERFSDVLGNEDVPIFRVLIMASYKQN
jgi:hypothetical protein